MAPWAFGFLALVPVIVALYLLRIRRRGVTVSTLLFWKQVLEESRRRALFQRLRNLLSLLLHLLIFLLILLALARPEWKRFLPTGESTVLILDARARMNALEKGVSRFDIAKKRAIALTRRASSFNEMAVIAAHSSPEVVAPFSSDEAGLQDAVEAVEPTHAPGSLAPSIDLARRLLAARGGKGRILALTPEPLQEEDVTVIPIGSSQDNVAITAFAARPLPNSPRTSQVFLEVQNFGSSPVAGSVEIMLDGDLIDVRPYKLDVNGISRTTFDIAPSAVTGRGWLAARLDKGDALPLDNVAYAALPSTEPTRVLLVTESDWFLENLLRASELITFELLSSKDFRPEMGGAFDVVIADGFVPEGFEMEQTPGNWLFLGTSPFGASDAALAQPVVTGEASGHPLLRLTNLKDVLFIRSRTLEVPPERWRPVTVLESAGSPIAITAERPREDGLQRIAAFGFTTADSDLPLRLAFPLLISNTIQWLAGGIDTEPLAAQAGEFFEVTEESFNADHAVDRASTRRKINPLKNGFYRLRQAGADRWLAVNTFSPAESDLRHSPAAAGSVAPREISVPSPALWPLWYYLAVAALLLFTLEWFLYHRRKTE